MAERESRARNSCSGCLSVIVFGAACHRSYDLNVFDWKPLHWCYANTVAFHMRVWYAHQTLECRKENINFDRTNVAQKCTYSIQATTNRSHKHENKKFELKFKRWCDDFDDGRMYRNNNMSMCVWKWWIRNLALLPVFVCARTRSCQPSVCGYFVFFYFLTNTNVSENSFPRESVSVSIKILTILDIWIMKAHTKRCFFLNIIIINAPCPHTTTSHMWVRMYYFDIIADTLTDTTKTWQRDDEIYTCSLARATDLSWACKQVAVCIAHVRIHSYEIYRNTTKRTEQYTREYEKSELKWNNICANATREVFSYFSTRYADGVRRVRCAVCVLRSQ